VSGAGTSLSRPALAARARAIRGFYAIVGDDAVDTSADPDAAAARAAALTDVLVAAGAPVVQVRLKHAPVRSFVAVGRAVAARCRAAGVLFVVNDRLDLALALGADGVHLGQDDLALAEARAAAGDRLFVGISTHTPAQAAAAAAAGADYLGFGPVYATRTKANPDPVQGVAALAEAVRLAAPVPVVAIGGVTPERAAEVAAAGAAAACVVAAVNLAADVSTAARTIGAAFQRTP
jgi:thiamine-phosphate diphosphorylase